MGTSLYRFDNDMSATADNAGKPKRKRRWLQLVTLFILLAIIPSFCLFIFVSDVGQRVGLHLYTVNSYLTRFVVSFDIVNETGEPVDIMPIGMWEGDGSYGPLPQFAGKFPSVHALSSSTTATLESGQEYRVYYNYDDINFRHIIVRDVGGQFYLFDTDRRGTQSKCYPPLRSSYAIPPLDQLYPLPSSLYSCWQGKNTSYSEAKEYPAE